ncbi:MAG TPA: hypothetical protein DEB39_11715 [Planctomycetaceae bacterium]|nr:hypothetical protein [Planctomycetaceae bacterium]
MATLERLLNPVLVREARQAVRNRFVVVLVCLFLAALFAAGFVILLYGRAGVPLSYEDRLGARLFTYYLGITFAVTAATVTLQTGCRLIAERIGEEMTYYTTLSPLRIAFGKFTGGLVLSLLFYSIALPFFTLAYLARGIDFGILFLLTVLSFLLVQTLNALVLGFFAGVRSWFDAVLRLVPFTVFAWVILWLCLDLGAEIFRIPDLFFGNRHNCVAVGLLSLFFYLVLPAALLLLASCQLAPVSSNRMFGMRVFLTLSGLLSLAVALVVDFCIGRDHVVMLWNLLAMYPCIFMCFIACCERETYGLRYRAGIPLRFWRRLAAFPHYTGDCNAVVWLACWITLGVGTGLAISLNYRSANWLHQHCLPVFSTILLSFDYAVATIGVQHLLRRLFPRHIPKDAALRKETAWLLLLGLLSVGLLLSLLWLQLGILLYCVPHPLWIWEGCGSRTESWNQLILAGVWFLLSIPPLIVWARRRFAGCVRYEPEKQETPGTESHESRERSTAQ